MNAPGITLEAEAQHPSACAKTASLVSAGVDLRRRHTWILVLQPRSPLPLETQNPNRKAHCDVMSGPYDRPSHNSQPTSNPSER